MPRLTGPSTQAALERLQTLHPKGIDLTLGRTERICAALGDPQKRLPPVVHVAGTNGKGSTIALLRAMAEAAGLRVHVYSSPHLVHFAERIRLAGKLIDDAYLGDVIDRVETANAGQPLTFFEATTAAAFLAFSETPADLLLLETGLGGILDSTNVIEQPRLTIITPIDYDHKALLGNDLTTIAKQKAGIIKQGVPVISARQPDEAEAVIVRQALKRQATLHAAGEGFYAYEENGRLVFQDEDALFDLPLPDLQGAHQIDNAALAIKAARLLNLPTEAIETGLQTAFWPARMQRLKAGPLFDALPAQSELWLDGGHNPHAARALRAHLDALQLRDPKPLHLICGLLNTKDASEFFSAFDGLNPVIQCVGFASDAAIPPETLVETARAKNLEASVAQSPLEAIRQLENQPQRVLICGSLYLAGEVLSLSPETWPQ